MVEHIEYNQEREPISDLSTLESVCEADGELSLIFRDFKVAVDQYYLTLTIIERWKDKEHSAYGKLVAVQSYLHDECLASYKDLSAALEQKGLSMGFFEKEPTRLALVPFIIKVAEHFSKDGEHKQVEKAA
jgi:hypothetical protein